MTNGVDAPAGIQRAPCHIDACAPSSARAEAVARRSVRWGSEVTAARRAISGGGRRGRCAAGRVPAFCPSARRPSVTARANGGTGP
jgi:hypothetical protein